MISAVASDGHNDTAEAGGRRPWHNNKRVILQNCRQNDGQTIMKNVEQACAPFQFALSIAWDMLCVASDHDLEAYDHVYRSTILSKLHEVSSFRSILLVVRKTYARASTC